MLHLIGIGSPFGDDRIGCLMIDELRRSKRLQLHLGCEIELLSADRPGAGILSLLEGKESVVIIDAVITDGAMVGQLHSWAEPALIEDKCIMNSSHGIGLAQSLALAQALGALPPQLRILGIEIAPPEGVFAELTSQLRQQLPALVEKVVDEIISINQTPFLIGHVPS